MQESTADKLQNEPEPASVSRKVRRATMRDRDNKLIRKIEVIESEFARLYRSNLAMNAYLVDIANIAGVPVPQAAAEGVNAADLLRERIKGLVEFERQAKAETKGGQDGKAETVDGQA
jgi:hypothetical protein